MAYQDLDKRRAFFREKYAERCKRAIEFLGGKCAVCGETEKLEFDHTIPEEKNFTVTKKLNNGPWERLEEELRLCQLLCHDCHKEKNKVDNGEAQHGTASKYKKGCRCNDCREAGVAGQREYRRKKRLLRAVGKASSMPHTHSNVVRFHGPPPDCATEAER